MNDLHALPSQASEALKGKKRRSMIKIPLVYIAKTGAHFLVICYNM